jgi:tRNA A37 threonylcarbamoyltransferase TsaD
VLGIESSFDDTGVAVVSARRTPTTTTTSGGNSSSNGGGGRAGDVAGVASGWEGSGILLGEGRITQRGQHAATGGTVPLKAAELHAANLPVALEKALAEAGLAVSDVDAVACTVGPGLGPCD